DERVTRVRLDEVVELDPRVDVPLPRRPDDQPDLRVDAEVVYLEELVVLEAARHGDGARDGLPIEAALVDGSLNDGDGACGSGDVVAARGGERDAEGELEVERLGEVDHP